MMRLFASCGPLLIAKVSTHVMAATHTLSCFFREQKQGREDKKRPPEPSVEGGGPEDPVPDRVVDDKPENTELHRHAPEEKAVGEEAQGKARGSRAPAGKDIRHLAKDDGGETDCPRLPVERAPRGKTHPPLPPPLGRVPHSP